MLDIRLVPVDEGKAPEEKGGESDKIIPRSRVDLKLRGPDPIYEAKNRLAPAVGATFRDLYASLLKRQIVNSKWESKLYY
jgi:hypothetical protein